MYISKETWREDRTRRHAGQYPDRVAKNKFRMYRHTNDGININTWGRTTGSKGGADHIFYTFIYTG